MSANDAHRSEGSEPVKTSPEAPGRSQAGNGYGISGWVGQGGVEGFRAPRLEALEPHQLEGRVVHAAFLQDGVCGEPPAEPEAIGHEAGAVAAADGHQIAPALHFHRSRRHGIAARAVNHPRGPRHVGFEDVIVLQGSFIDDGVELFAGMEAPRPPSSAHEARAGVHGCVYLAVSRDGLAFDGEEPIGPDDPRA